MRTSALRRLRIIEELRSMREERRRAWRFPVLEEQQRAELRVGDASMNVRLVDQSATGFLIECDERPGVYAGENVWLQTTGGWTEVKVIKIRHEIDRTCIGLERLADVSLDAPSSTGVIKRDALEHEVGNNSPWPAIIMTMALGGVMGFLAWTAYDRHNSQRLMDVISGVDHSKDGKSTVAVALENEAQRRSGELKKSITQFGAALLTLPEVVRQLKLSEDQTARLRKVISEAMASERQLRTKASGGELQAQIASLHAEATQRALAILNSEQQAAWNEMHQAAVTRLQNDAPAQRPGKP